MACWSVFYSSILCFRADALHSCRIAFWMSDCMETFYSAFIKYPPLWCTYSAVWLLLQHETDCRLGARSVSTIQPRSSSQCHSKQHKQGACTVVGRMTLLWYQIWLQGDLTVVYVDWNSIRHNTRVNKKALWLRFRIRIPPVIRAHKARTYLYLRPFRLFYRYHIKVCK